MKSEEFFSVALLSVASPFQSRRLKCLVVVQVWMCFCSIVGIKQLHFVKIGDGIMGVVAGKLGEVSEGLLRKVVFV